MSDSELGRELGAKSWGAQCSEVPGPTDAAPGPGCVCEGRIGTLIRITDMVYVSRRTDATLCFADEQGWNTFATYMSTNMRQVCPMRISVIIV